MKKTEGNTKLKILLIEDNQADVDLINILLSQSVNSSFHYDLTTAKNLKQGFLKLHNHHYDVILLDLFLPDSKGLETLTQTCQETQKIPIIILTGLHDVSLGRKAVRLGAQDYLVKGEINENQLIQAIFHSIERKSMNKTIKDLASDLKNEQKKLQKIIELNADAILIINKEGRVKFVNPAAKQMFGREIEDFIDQNFGYPVQSGEKLEIEIIQRDGNIRYAEMKSVQIEWEKEDAYLLSLRDITEHHKFEELLQESEKKYRELFEKTPYPILILDKKGQIIDCNSNFERLLKIQRETLLDRYYRDTLLKPMEDLSLFEGNGKDLNRNKLPNPTEIKLEIHNGDHLWLKLNFSLIRLDEEDLIHILIQDLTKIKKSKEEVRKLEKTLHEMNSLIEYAPLAIFLMHTNGKILRANSEAQYLFKYNESELLTHTIYELIDDKSIERIKKYYRFDIFDKEESKKIEAQIKTKSGEKINVEITSTILKIAENYIIQSFISDITKRKNYERNREALLDQLIKSLEFKSKFLAAMSHDLRTPLNAIVGFSSLLLDGAYGELNESQYDYLKDIYTAADHLTGLIDSILDFSKIEAGKFELNFEEFHLQRIIKQVHSTLKPLYKKKELYFNVENVKKEIKLIADPLRMKQIFYNLLDNAIKFTDNGGITLKAIERGDHWEFQVKDTGMGIEKADYDVVFREFGMVERDLRKDISGSGIGLALTKRLVQQHGGDIWFRSVVGQGTTFFFTIPKDLEIKNTNRKVRQNS